MRHLLFVGITFALIMLVLVSVPSHSTQEQPAGTARIVEDTAPSQDGVVCCTFLVGERTRTCAVLHGQTCDACEQACAAAS